MIDFLGRRYLLFFVSAVLICAGPVAYLSGYGLKSHIDFAGGTEVRLTFEQALEIGSVRNAVRGAGFDDAVIQCAGSTGRGFLVTLNESRPGVSDELVAAVTASLQTPVVVEGVEVVGAAAGQEVRLNALISILLTLLVLLGYVAFFHSFSYGVGAIVALLHDLFLLFAFLVIFQIPFSLQVLAAVLALLGYSLNDTVVIFSRIRENAQNSRYSRDSAYDIVKISLNDVLSRTLKTSLSTFIALVPLIIIGGSSVYYFALTMAVSVVIGTYSSVYVASPIVLALGNNRL